MKNFDRVADIYDATRELPPGVAERIADRVVAATGAGAETRFLEIGVGTGRIALPLLERGYRYTGVDISERMMDRLRAKVRDRDVSLTLVNADITHLPWEDASFDVALAVHILHLVPDWRTALQEVLRVLRPEGYLLVGYENRGENDPESEIRDRWHAFVEEAGVTLAGRGGKYAEIEAALIESGAYSSVYRVAEWYHEVRPRTQLDEQRNQVFSHSWDVPDNVLAAVHERMAPWAMDRYGSLDAVLRSEHEFLLSVNRFQT